jgi:predicted RNA-binding Zn-ribbon protein involved in translation (DUF1610 family)
MSVRDTVEAKCPACGEESSVTVWRAINATNDPDARELLLAGSVNVFSCPKCRYESLLDIDLLYHDMERKFSVQYYPFERLADDGFLEAFDAEGRLAGPLDLPGNAEYLRRPHIVFELGELVRYIAFRERLHGVATGSGD